MKSFRFLTNLVFVGACATHLFGVAAGLRASNLPQALQGNSTVTATGTKNVYSGSDGTVEFDWTAPVVGTANLLGTIHISAHLNGSDGEMDVPLGAAQANLDLVLQSVQLIPASGSAGAYYKLNFKMGSTPMSVTVLSTLVGKTLNTDIQADHPFIADIYGNIQPQTSNISALNIPYYTGTAVYFSDWGMFGNFYFDWQNSNASEIDPMQAAYNPLTNGSRNVARDRLVLSMSENLSEVLPVINNPPSVYQAQLAGRTVIDIWNQGDFNQITQALTALGNSGVKNCAVIIHNWQQSGYDNALPATFPANSPQGGNSQLALAVAAARNMGCYVGVHENYTDYYPNYSNFTFRAVALNSDHSEMAAWFNPVTDIQSYQTKQTWMLPNAATQSPAIHSALNTNASFVDVISASYPWYHTDMDSTQSGAGQFSNVINTYKNLWGYEQKTHGGPVFGEGLNHWFWSGLLDGVEAQFGAGSLYSQAEQNPLFVDFDLLKIHPLQVNHGMGMYERWLTPGESITQTNLMDAYRMQEVIYGHAPYIGGSFWQNPARVLQEQNLVSPVAQRYGTQTATYIGYQVNGTWTDSNTAAKAGSWSRVAVQYSNGDTFIANGQAQPLNLGIVTLPQYGWAAQGTNMMAYTALVNGLIGDYVQTATSFYANARNQADQNASGNVAQPSVSAFLQTGPRTFNYQLNWKVLDGPQGVNLCNFIHFVDASGNVVFQGDYPLSIPTTLWKPGQVESDPLTLVLDPSVPDGTYSMRIGLYSTLDWTRVPELGVDDGTKRYILGNVVVSNHGQTITFQAQAMPALPFDPRMNGSGSVVDFSTIRTDGMVSINANQGKWSLQTYPRFRNVMVQLNASQFPAPHSISCDSVGIQAPTVINGYWQLQTNGAQACTWAQ